MKKVAYYLPVVLILRGFGIYFWLKPHAFYGDAVSPIVPAPNFTLAGPKGSVSLADYHGKLVLLFFGYSSCDDECPTTLANVKAALQQLGDQAGSVQMVMISVDPERDRPDKLAAWVQKFDPAFLGLTGSKEQIDQVTSQYGVYYKKQAGSAPDKYSVDHTLSMFVINRDGQVVLQSPYGNTPAQVADDLAYLLK